MARKVFFSFHFDRDAWRVGQVRNSGVVTAPSQQSQFLDHADWEAIRRRGREAIKNWIDGQLYGSTITCVLIGNETDSREWVHYEIEQSILRKNAILGIDIHNLKNQGGYTDNQGRNPFLRHSLPNYHLATIAPTYDWVNGNGYSFFGDWIENAVKNFKDINHFRGE